MKIKLHEKEDLRVQKAKECIEDIDYMMSYLEAGKKLVSKVANGENLGDLDKFSLDLEEAASMIAEFKWGVLGRTVDNMKDLARFAEDGSI